MSLGSEPEQQTHSCEHGGDGVSLLSFRSMKGGRAGTFNSSAGQGGEIDTGVDQEAEALEMMMDYEQLYAEAVGMVPEELTNACKSMDRNSDGEITEEDFQQAPRENSKKRLMGKMMSSQWPSVSRERLKCTWIVWMRWWQQK